MDPERDGYASVGSSVATIAAEIRTAGGRVRPLAEDDSLQVVPGDSVDLDLAGLALGHYSQCHSFLVTRTDPSALFKIRPLLRLTTRASSSVECSTMRGANAPACGR